MRDEDRPTEADELARECVYYSVQRFIRENFGLYAPPADYAALRAENLRRTRAAQKG